MFRGSRATRALLAAAPLLAGCAPSRDEAPRNLLWIAVDTLRADRLGTYGYDRPTSPAIDRLFEGAVVFEEARAASSWTLPSFATLLTSAHTSTHGCWTFDNALSDSFTTLPELLAQAGFRTAGVVSHVFLGSEYGLHQGFEHYDEELVHATLRASHRAISSPELTDKAIRLLEGWSDPGPHAAPWFLFVHYFDPHKGYQLHDGISEGFGTQEASDKYDGEIAFTDRHIGRLLEALQRLGLEQDTLVAFVADHGEEFGEHGGEEHGRTLHREVVRVPFALRVPGVAPRRLRVPVAAVDFLPTMLDLLGVPAPELPLAGRSLAPALRGEPLEPTGILMELGLDREGAGTTHSAYALGPWKLIETSSDGEPTRVSLFDLARDPGEQEDVAQQHADVVADLGQRMRTAIDDAEARAANHDAAPELELSPEELERLRDLGYAGGEDPE